VRYILTSVVIVGLFGAALYMRGAEPDSPRDNEAIVLKRSPEVHSEKIANGTALQVRYRFAGSCSRASVVYRHEGKDKVLASTTSCRRQLDAGSASSMGQLEGDGYINEVELAGTLPNGASDVRLVLESETGTRVAPVKL
jgi:hypothetical protein